MVDIPFRLEITRGTNGYRVSWMEQLDDGACSQREEYIQADTEDGLKAHEELLWQIMEYFDFGGSKHDSERLRIIREKQE